MQNSSIINDLRLVSQSDGICCSAAIHLYFVPFSVSLLVLMKRQAHCLIFSRAVEITNKLLSKQILQSNSNNQWQMSCKGNASSYYFMWTNSLITYTETKMPSRTRHRPIDDYQRIINEAQQDSDNDSILEDSQNPR